MPYYAHSRQDRPEADWHPLAAHLRAVARLAERFAVETGLSVAGFEQQARLAGLLHDFGKYRTEFQEMLRGRRAKGEATRHKQAGVAAALKHPVAAAAIAGHHGGVPNWIDLGNLINAPGGRDVCEMVRHSAEVDCPDLAGLAGIPPLSPARDGLDIDFQVRLLFSCLVDADWQDTSEFHDGAAGRCVEPPTPELDPEIRLQHILNYVAERAKGCRNSRVGKIREEILAAALEAAHMGPGLFSMTVPTGGGKTLSALAFAFEHARRNNLRRVIYVAPYLSILEQNVREIRRALDVDATSAVVFEHHSLSEPLVHDDDIDAAQTSARLMRAENWDAPVVVTTNVQFFESLFANQPGRCRKLHNIARSVVVLDECQILPPHLIAPTCGMLNQWAQSAGSSLVLCTATQPAWLQRPNLPTGLVAVREIAPAKLELFRRLRRSKVEWPQPTDQDWEWSAVAARMQTELAALCVVNTIKAARDALDVLRQSGCLSALHLSAHMCPAHRLQVIDEVRRRLAAGEPCHLVSTQLIEAGVDVDFPLVLRELAPFETVIQAAGRCNREGLLNTPGGEPGGKVVVFRSRHGGLPPGWYKRGTEVLEHLLNDGQPPNIDRPEDIQAYFQRLYLAGDLDSHEIHDHRQAKRFQLVAERYRLIEGESQPVVVLNWWARQAEIETLLKTAERQPSRLNLRRLTPFQVNIARWKLASARPLIDETTWNVAVWNGPYDETLGIELQGGADYVV